MLFAFAGESSFLYLEIKESSLVKKVDYVLERTFSWFDANRLALKSS